MTDPSSDTGVGLLWPDILCYRKDARLSGIFNQLRSGICNAQSYFCLHTNQLEAQNKRQSFCLRTQNPQKLFSPLSIFSWAFKEALDKKAIGRNQSLNGNFFVVFNLLCGNAASTEIGSRWSKVQCWLLFTQLDRNRFEKFMVRHYKIQVIACGRIAIGKRFLASMDAAQIQFEADITSPGSLEERRRHYLAIWAFY